MANTMVEEAEEKKKAMLAGAEDEARAKIGALQSDVELEQRSGQGRDGEFCRRRNLRRRSCAHRACPT